MSKRIR